MLCEYCAITEKDFDIYYIIAANIIKEMSWCRKSYFLEPMDTLNLGKSRPIGIPWLFKWRQFETPICSLTSRVNQTLYGLIRGTAAFGRGPLGKSAKNTYFDNACACCARRKHRLAAGAHAFILKNSTFCHFFGCLFNFCPCGAQ